MNTDYIDIYQLHWPNRGSYMFRKNWQYDPTSQDRAAMHAHVDEVLDEMDRLVQLAKSAISGCPMKVRGAVQSGLIKPARKTGHAC